ncbi:MAG: radical SAM family heme chaperone HemW [Clostridia bacterium]|nr:radical SAM family heme chaperone HemW [Clostridia bacterium]
MSANENKKLGIYIHVPFCRSKCLYCDFYSLPAARAELIESYISYLCDHIRMLGEAAKGRTVDTVFMGGGTPTLLSLSQLERITNALGEVFSIEGGAEFTMEANPATFDLEKLLGIKGMGVNRISIGMQSAAPEELRLIGRSHRIAEVESAVDAVNRAGFDNFNLDIMYGIPDQTWVSFIDTLKVVERLSPAHVSVYGLQLEEGTPLYNRREKYIFPTEDEEKEMNRLALYALESAGYKRYEISNYAREGYECKHNLRYWKQGEYLGIGAAAHSYFNAVRYRAPDSIDEYIDAVNRRDIASLTLDGERIDGEEYASEYIMLRMRLTEGVSPEEFRCDTGADFSVYERRMQPFVCSGHIKYENGRYFFSAEGFDVSNYILAQLI